MFRAGAYPFRRSPRINVHCNACITRRAFMIARTFLHPPPSLAHCLGMRLHMSRICYPRVIWNDVRYARCDPKLDYLYVCNSGIVSRRFAANDEEDGTVSINFSFARRGQKVIDAPLRCTAVRYFYCAGDNKNPLTRTRWHNWVHTYATVSLIYRVAPATESNWQILKFTTLITLQRQELKFPYFQIPFYFCYC